MPWTPYSQRSRPPRGRPGLTRGGRTPCAKETALTTQHNDLTFWPITGPDELGRFNHVPMAAAFHRAGWRTTGHQIDMTWEQPG